MHLENPPVPVGPRNYRFTDFARNPEKIPPVYLLLIGFPPQAQQPASRKPTCAGPTQILLFHYFTILLFYYFTILLFYYFTILLFYYFTILLFYYFTILLFYYFYEKSGVCISKTHLCRLDPEITDFLISREIQRKFLPLSLLLIGFPPRAQQFASRKPTCAGPTQILLFYYFTILLFYYFTILLFYYFTILLFYYFTILLFYYFTILLFYYFNIFLFDYFTILLILREIGSLHLENPPVLVGPRNYRFPDFARNPENIHPSLFTFNRISSTASAVCISKTHLCRSDPDLTILLFYYFTILLFFLFY